MNIYNPISHFHCILSCSFPLRGQHCSALKFVKLKSLVSTVVIEEIGLVRLSGVVWFTCALCVYSSTLSFFFFFKFYLFIYFWLRWVFVAACWLSLVAASGGYSSLQCAGFSLRWLLLLQSTSSRHVGFSSCGTWASVVVARGLSSCGSWAQ